MVTIVLANQYDVRAARQCALLLAEAAGVADPGMVEQAVAEISNNCVEHRDGSAPALLRIGCAPGRLVLRAENACSSRPTWQTAKPMGVDGFREGGYGLLLVRAIARSACFRWVSGRVVVRAEFC